MAPKSLLQCTSNWSMGTIECDDDVYRATLRTNGPVPVFASGLPNLTRETKLSGANGDM